MKRKTANMKTWNLQPDVFSTKGGKDAVKETDALLFAPDAIQAVPYKKCKYLFRSICISVE
jgi:hypothetical protein